MNKAHRFLIPGISLLLVGTMFNCANKNVNDNLFGIKTNVTITFNAGVGTWGETGTSIRELTLLKGYTWGYIQTYLKDDLKSAIIDGQDIDVIKSGERHFVEEGERWLLPQEFDEETPINNDIIVTANYAPEYINITFIASPEDEEPSHHTIGGEKKLEITADQGAIEKGAKWIAIKDIKDDSDAYKYIPICTTEGTNEPFLYYLNSDGEKISDEYTLKDGDTLTAVYQINHPSQFTTDSWETISDAANLGLESMKKLTLAQGGYADSTEYSGTTYSYHGTQYEKEANTFVGLRHEVQIGKKVYDAVVIGENVDKISSTMNATLTFQIEEIVNTNKAYDTAEHNLNRYSESALREYLNDNFKYTLSPDLQNAIIPVNKLTNWGGKEDSRGDVRESLEYIFPLSLKELDIDTTYDDSVLSENEGFGINHDEPYVFYNNADPSSRIRKPLKSGSSAMTYWVRSPDPDATGFAHLIDDTGNVVRYPTDGNVLNSYGVVCAFCVGAKR